MEISPLSRDIADGRTDEQRTNGEPDGLPDKIPLEFIVAVDV